MTIREPICLPVEVRPVPGFPNYYVSADGQLRGPGRGRRRAIGGGVPMRPAVNTNGHLFVSVRQGGARRKLYLHRAVLMAWVGPCPAGQECRHLDGDPTNNHVSNLKWGTSAENSQDSVQHGNHHLAKLTEDDVREIRRLFGSTSIASLARSFGVHPKTLTRAATGYSWRHIDHLSREEG
jgi:hypothetical protein